MKAAILALLMLATVPLLAAQTPNVVLTWQPNPANATAWPNCGANGAAPQTTCIVSTGVTDITSLSSPVVLTTTIPAATLTFTLATVPSPGSHSYVVFYEAKDQSGNAVLSANSNTATVTVPSSTPNPPVGLAATP